MRGSDRTRRINDELVAVSADPQHSTDPLGAGVALLARRTDVDLRHFTLSFLVAGHKISIAKNPTTPEGIAGLFLAVLAGWFAAPPANPNARFDCITKSAMLLAFFHFFGLLTPWRA